MARLYADEDFPFGVFITCTTDANSAALALRIDSAVRSCESLNGKLIRIVRPNPPRPQQT